MYTKIPADGSDILLEDVENSSDHHRLRNLEKTDWLSTAAARSRLFWIVLISITFIILSDVIVRTALLFFPDSASCRLEQPIWCKFAAIMPTSFQNLTNFAAPAQAAVPYVEFDFSNAFSEPSVYRGPPTRELEKAWRQLYMREFSAFCCLAHIAASPILSLICGLFLNRRLHKYSRVEDAPSQSVSSRVYTIPSIARRIGWRFCSATRCFSSTSLFGAFIPVSDIVLVPHYHIRQVGLS